MGKKKKKNNNKIPTKSKNNNNQNNQKKNTEEKKVVNAKRVVKEINNIIKKATIVPKPSIPKPIVPKKWQKEKVDEETKKIEVKELVANEEIEETALEPAEEKVGEIEDKTKELDTEELEVPKEQEEPVITKIEEEEDDSLIKQIEEYRDTLFDDKSLISKIVIILVLIIISLILVIYNQSIDNKHAKDYIPVASKHDKDKDYVFNATYKSNAKAHESIINGNTYYADNIIVPYINFRTADADLVNNKIKHIYNKAIGVFNKGLKDKKSYVEELKYNYYVNSDIVSVVITYKYFLTDKWNTKYYVYNFDTEKGIMVTTPSLLKKGHMKKDVFYNALETAIINHLKETNDDYKSYMELKDLSIKRYKALEKKQVFMASNQTINVIVPICYNKQNCINTIIEVK